MREESEELYQSGRQLVLLRMCYETVEGKSFFLTSSETLIEGTMELSQETRNTRGWILQSVLEVMLFAQRMAGT